MSIRLRMTLRDRWLERRIAGKGLDVSAGRAKEDLGEKAMAEEASENLPPPKDGSRQEALKSWMRALEAVKDLGKDPEATLPARLARQATING